MELYVLSITSHRQFREERSVGRQRTFFSNISQWVREESCIPQQSAWVRQPGRQQVMFKSWASAREVWSEFPATGLAAAIASIWEVHLRWMKALPLSPPVFLCVSLPLKKYFPTSTTMLGLHKLNTKKAHTWDLIKLYPFLWALGQPLNL